MPTGATPQVHFAIERWSAWTPPSLGAKAEIPEVPPLLRRRASDADRAALRVAFDCVGVIPGPLGPGLEAGLCPAVFCSRHGEVQRSVELLDQLSKNEPMSPMTFSLSVHNSAAALYSLTRRDTSALSAIAAGRDSLHQGILDAAAMLHQGVQKVLVVGYDDSLPESFKSYKDDDDTVHALALLLSKPPQNGATEYILECQPGLQEATQKPQTAQVAEFLASGVTSLEIPSCPRRWLWRKV